MRARFRTGLLTTTIIGLGFLVPGVAGAETLDSALSRAYTGNPTLNAQRASLRATNEGVPQALSGYRPRVNATVDVGAEANTLRGPLGNSQPGGGNGSSSFPRGAALTVDQSIFNGFRTQNSVRAAESQVFGGRETLRNTEQNVLLDAATSYMNVLRDTAILQLQRNNVDVLQEQLRQTQDRFKVGEVTRTDVAQAESRLALARSQVIQAEANLKTSIARYRQNIGTEPKQLAPGRSIEKLLPASIDGALRTALAEHPAINAAMHGVDSALLQVKVIEGELAPSLSVRGTLQRRYDYQGPNNELVSAAAVATLSIPIYEGGQVYSRARQAKETAGQQRLTADVTREQVRAAVVSAWGDFEAAKAAIESSQAQVQAAEVALNGVREEAKVGQRTTLDVLNAQQELLNARVNLITAQRDRVVASYAVLSSIGRLGPSKLGLNVSVYDAKRHFDQVRDRWWGLTTPDGQ